MRKLKCLRCGHVMDFAGQEKLQLGQAGWILGDLPNLFAGALEVQIYCCPSSVSWNSILQMMQNRQNGTVMRHCLKSNVLAAGKPSILTTQSVLAAVIHSDKKSEPNFGSLFAFSQLCSCRNNPGCRRWECPCHRNRRSNRTESRSGRSDGGEWYPGRPCCQPGWSHPSVGSCS